MSLANTITDQIRKRPGITPREIIGNLGLSRGAFEYHAHHLRSRKVVVKHLVQGQANYFPVPGPSSRELLRLKYPYIDDVLALAIDEGLIGPSDVSAKLGIPGSNVRRALNGLVEQGELLLDDGYHPRFWVPSER
jgi:predicted transcriptional regulator